jgi:hypothetical protein
MTETDEELKFAAERVAKAVDELNSSLALANEYGLMVIFGESQISEQIGRRWKLKHYNAEILKPLT